jgi:hypothetical protein
MSESFEQWLVREIPPGTVISNPLWWAPKIRQALQHSGEPVAWMSPNKQSLEFSRPDTVYGSHTIPLYTTPQPVVPEVVFDILKAAQGSCRLGLNDIADKQIEIAIKALLSAGKGDKE